MKTISMNMAIDLAFHLLPTARDADGFYIGSGTGMKGYRTTGACLFKMSSETLYPEMYFNGESGSVTIHSTKDGFKVVGFNAHEVRHGGFTVIEKVLRGFIHIMESDIASGTFAPTQIYYMERLVLSMIRNNASIKANGKVLRGFSVLAHRFKGYNINTHILADKNNRIVRLSGPRNDELVYSGSKMLPFMDGKMVNPVPFRLSA